MAVEAKTETAVEDVAAELGVTPTDLNAILDDVETALTRLADLDLEIGEPADLERARRALPTDPLRAEFVDAALRGTPVGNALEYVHSSERQAGYWRRSAERSDPAALSDAELLQRHAFVTSRLEHRGVEGTVTLADGREVPRSVLETGATLRGESFDPDAKRESPADEAKGKGILARITDQL